MAPHPDSSSLTELADRLQLAAKADADQLALCLQDSAEEVLFIALRNPSLSERHLLQMLKRRELGERLLDAIARLSQAETSHQVKKGLAFHPAISQTRLTALIPQLYLFDLVQLSAAPGATLDQKAAAEREVLRRLPTTPLGTKVTLARRATSEILKALVFEGLPPLLEPCLDNPRLNEGVLHQFLRSSRANAETISLIARHPRWQGRPLLRQAILKNARTPEVWYTLWLPRMPLMQVKELAASTRLGPSRGQLLKQELQRRGLG